MASRRPSPVGGYVLAGGKSSRMGRDKALLELAGKPLALHAVLKLRRVCSEVYLLGNRSELSAFAPVIEDLHEDCGPLSGIEAALEQTRLEWNLFMPVDVPFLPSTLLGWWMELVQQRQKDGVRLAIFTAGGYPQPALCMLHQDVRPYVKRAMQRSEFRLFPLFNAIGRELDVKQGLPSGTSFFNFPLGDDGSPVMLGQDEHEAESRWVPTIAQQETRHLWFANLNTPEEFALAEQNAKALDT